MKIIGYLTSGYPSIDKSIETARRYVDAGCNMLEISIPLENNREKPFLNEIMKQAYAACPDYNEHMEAVIRIAKAMPDVPVTVLLYDEVLKAIGTTVFADAMNSCGIHDVNSANLTDEEIIGELEMRDIHLAGLVTYDLIPWRIEQARRTRGFVYCQAFPRAGQNLNPEADSVEKLIPYLRRQGISGPLYCGGGIATPEDAVRVMRAGADGFFLGSSIIALYDRPQELHRTISEFAEAARQLN